MPKVDEIISLIKGGVNKQEEEILIEAYKAAEGAHAGQKRMSGEPYFIHPFEIAKILAQLGMDVQTIVAGLLHDVLEDTKITEKELEEKFGPEVLGLVSGVTSLGKLKYRGRERHVESLRKFFFAMASDLRVVIVKFADRLHNLRTLQHLPEAKRKRIAIESIDVYAPLANRLGMWKLKSEIEEAAFPFAYPVEYKQIEEIVEGKKSSYEKNLSKVKTELERELEKSKNKVVEINYRVKNNYSLWRKLIKREMDINKIYDMIALRIIVEDVEECYRILGLIHSIWRPLPSRIKDYIAIPKPNGYQSIHTTIFTGGGQTAEIQIKTREMQAEAIDGIAAYFAYKEKKEKKNGNNTDEKFKLKWLEELKGLNYTSNDSGKFLENLKMDFFNDRIFVFTPQGDVIDLPEDSTAIDFAYSIHSDIGNHTSGVKINGKMSNIFSELKNRDIVEIITKSDAHPSSKWLEHTKTTIAKKHIKQYLEKNSLLSRLKSFGQS
ncbi:MAG: RelA/SpoT family protein [Patescibacteria group bacterium]